MKDEPVLNDAGKQLLITVITWLAAKYVPWLNMSTEQATALALAVLSGATALFAFITRKKTMAMTKVTARLEQDHPAALAALKRPS